MTNAEEAAKKRNPYPGLRPFREEEQHLFFGRESQVDAMVDKLFESRLLAVVGPSGSGKSSLVNCGLRPALHRGLMAGAGTTWRTATLRPGDDPLQAMARALAAEGVLFDQFDVAAISPEGIVETTLRMSKLGLIDLYQQARLGQDVNLLVVVDQFEELFRYRSLSGAAEDSTPRASEEAFAFVNLLLETHSTELPIYVVLTMRSDFLGDCAEFPGLPEAINDGQYLVPRMTRDERRSAIAGPAAVYGAEIDPVLLIRLVNDVGDNPDQLSILQHALNRTWACWAQHGARSALLLRHYEEIGTMEEALDRHAEEAYAQLDGPRPQVFAERLFKSLTDKATDRRGIRRPTKLSRLCTLAGAELHELTAVIDVFRHPSRSFLMPPAGEPLEPDKVIDISHESLMRVWSRLKRWADEEAESVRVYQRLVETAELHAAGRAGFLRDPELGMALDWREREGPTAEWAERFDPRWPQATRFLDESKASRDAQRRREKRRRLRGVAVTLVVAVLTAILSLLYANRQRSDADLQRRLVRSGLAEKENLVLDLLYGENPTDALLYAIQATGQNRWQYGEVPSSVTAVLSAAVEWARERRIVTPPVDPGPKVAPSGQEEESGTGAAPVAGVARAPVVGLTRNGKIVGRFPGDGRLHFFDSVGEPAGEPIEIDPNAPAQLAVSADGSTLVAARDASSLGVWGGSGRPIGSIPSEGATALALSSRGEHVAIAGDGRVEIWQARAPEKLSSFPTSGAVAALAFGLGGTLLAAAIGPEIMLWDTVREIEIGVLQGHNSQIHTLAISHDGNLLASGNGFEPAFSPPRGEARIWNLETRELIHELAVTTEVVGALAFAPGDRSLIVGANEQIEVWGVSEQQISPVFKGHTESITFVGVATRGPLEAPTIVSASLDGTLRLWDFPASPGARILHHQDPVNWATFGPDSDRVVTAGAAGEIASWPLDGRAPERDSEVSPLMILDIDENGIVVAGGRDLWFFDQRGAQVRIATDGEIWGLAISPDDRYVITAGTSGKVHMWDKARRAVVAELEGHEGKIWFVDVSPDGRSVVSAGADGTARLWDLATGSPRGAPMEGHDGEVTSAKFLPPDAQEIVTGGADGTLRTWGRDGNPRLAWKAHQGQVMTVGVSSDGRFLASGGSDGVLRVWRPDGSLSGQFLAHEDAIYSIEFGTIDVGDGGTDQMLLTSSQDGTARLWPSRLWDEGWESVLRRGCDRLRFHGLLMEPKSSVALDACLTCEEWTWREVVCSDKVPRPGGVASTNVESTNLWAPDPSRRGQTIQGNTR